MTLTIKILMVLVQILLKFRLQNHEHVGNLASIVNAQECCMDDIQAN